MTPRSATADRAPDAALRTAAEGATDVVRRRAHFDVTRWIAGAAGLRRIVELAHAEATLIAAPAVAGGLDLRHPHR